ncbi:MAG: hypothetical protein QUS11_04440 [Candidatus Fermentibacter sp.]|nr:hypothetical protein [Candidatus Fermentibacter sp.]
MSGERGSGGDLRIALGLAAVCVPLMVAQSVLGLFVEGTYAKDGVWGRAVWQGNDFVNLFVFAPMLVIAIILARKGTGGGRLFWLGIQALVTYDYVYYPLAVAYDRYFLVYLAVLGVSMYSFISGMHAIDSSRYSDRLPGRRTGILCRAMMTVFAAILALLWIGLSVHYILTGELKMQVTQMVSTFDLLLICTPVLLSVAWLSRGQARGYVLMTVMSLVSGLYCLVLGANTPFALRAGLPDAWAMLPLWGLLFVLSLPVAIILLAGGRGRRCRAG